MIFCTRRLSGALDRFVKDNVEDLNGGNIKKGRASGAGRESGAISEGRVAEHGRSNNTINPTASQHAFCLHGPHAAGYRGRYTATLLIETSTFQ